MCGWLEKEDTTSWLSTRKARYFVLTDNELEWHDDTDVRPAPRGRVLLTEDTSVKIQEKLRGTGLGGEYAGRWAEAPEVTLVLTSANDQHFLFGDRLEEWAGAIRDQLERGDLRVALAAAEEKRAAAEVRARVAAAEAADLRSALATAEARAEVAEAQASAADATATTVVVPVEPPATLEDLLRQLDQASLREEEYETVRTRLLSSWAAPQSAPPVVVVGKGVTEAVLGLPLPSSSSAPSDSPAESTSVLYFTDDEA